MQSIVFSLGNFSLSSYGLCMAIGIIVAYKILATVGRSRGFSEDFIGNVLLLTVFSGLIGARAFYVAEHWTSIYKADPWSALRIWEGGIMFYGSLICGSIAIVAMCAICKIKLLPLMDFLAIGVPVGQFFGRLGCFLNGCCYGKPYSGTLAVKYPEGSIPCKEMMVKFGENLSVWPSQLIESFGALIIFAVLIAVYLKFVPKGSKPDANKAGRVAAIYFAMYAVLRYCVEMTRGDTRMQVVFGLSISQAISLGLILLAVVLLLRSIATGRVSTNSKEK